LPAGMLLTALDGLTRSSSVVVGEEKLATISGAEPGTKWGCTNCAGTEASGAAERGVSARGAEDGKKTA